MIDALGKLSDYLGLPIAASERAPEIDVMIGWVHWLMLILFVGWGGFYLYTLFKFRSTKNPNADYRGVKSHLSSYLEGAVAVIEVILLVGFAFPIWADFKNELPETKDSLPVRIVAQQFAWNIHYPGADGVFGQTRPELVDEESNPVGLDRDGFGADDIWTVNQLHLPVNKKTLLYITSKDVIHGFALNEMRIKQDAIPGLMIPIYFTPNLTSAEFLEKVEGTAREGMGYEISCAQLCGNSHYRMRGFLTVETEEEFQAWLDVKAEEIEEDEDDWGTEDW